MSENQSFVHLHVHTHYSLLDGATRINQLVAAAKEMHMPAVAITDHGNMFGAVELYRQAIKHGVKPILGCEVYMAPGDRREKTARGMSEASYHLLLLAMNRIGYANLMKLCSIGYREGFYYRPRIDKEVLTEFNEGLLCTSTCLGGEIPQALVSENRSSAEEIAKTYLSVFGPDRFLIELQDHGMPEQQMINPELIDIGKRLGVGCIATNDVHYLAHEDVEAHDVLCCISTGKLVSETDRFKFPTDQFYLKSPAEMRDLFADHPDALDNTLRVADLCNVELDLSTRHAPVYQPPESKTPGDYLRELVYQGADRLYDAITDELRERIDYELQVIESKGFSSYFLIVWDLVHFARSEGIPCGARGSGCSSVVGYCLSLSSPDPMRYELYFERFMDPDRDEMPDIDIDICQHGRSDVIEYVRRKYGHVAQIITFNTLGAKAAIRDVSRVLGVSLADADRAAKLIPFELKMTLDKALAQVPELKKLYDEDEQMHRVIDIARRIEGLTRNAGVHAAGVVIADQPLENFVPLYVAPDSRGKSAKAGKPQTEQLITQYEGSIVEAVGLLKMDFLGLKTLSVIERARQLAEKNHDTKIDLDKLDLTDQKVYELFARGETKGIFQFESGGMRDVLMKMRPNRIEDLIAANALYRPGPMVNIEAYIGRKHGETWTTPHPIMTEVLEETFGIMVYQEQVSRLVNRLGGIELKRAFRLAKAISKKKTEMIEAEREPFVAGAVANGVAKSTVEQIFEDILRFGGYAFNKAHSTGYALIAFQTAYLKVYYPVEFLAAMLTFEMGSTDKLSEYSDECRRMGIEIKPPDVNVSGVDFTVVREGADKQASIRFGLAAIKGVGTKAVEEVIRAREAGERFHSLFDFCERVEAQAVNRAAIEAMIKCGAFDSTGAMRLALMNALPAAMEIGARSQRDKRAGQMSLFGTFDEATGGDPVEPPVGTEEWPEAEMLAHEKATLGFYVTKHPLARHADTLDKYATAHTVDLVNYDEGAEATLGGIITQIRMVVTRSGRNAGAKMGVVTVEDLKGQIEVIVFPKDVETYAPLLKQETLAFFRGRVDRRREQPSLRVSEIVPIDQADGQLTTAVVISVPCVGTTAEAVDKLRDVLVHHQGDRPVFLQFATPDGYRVTIRSNAGLSVAPTRLFLNDVNALLGPGHVTLVGPSKPKPRYEPPEILIEDEAPYQQVDEPAEMV